MWGCPAHDHGAGDLSHAIEGGIDLCTTDANASRVEGGIAASVDDHPSIGREFHIITVAPQTRVDVEIGVIVAAAVGIVEKSQGHAGQRLTAYELARLTQHCFAILVEGRH